jgi:hypothetical protein
MGDSDPSVRLPNAIVAHLMIQRAVGKAKRVAQNISAKNCRQF